MQRFQVLANLLQKRNNILLFALILVSGIFLRSYSLETYPFGFDQVQIEENAQSIASGDITLIGPRTGPAPMFTGPLIYYLAAPFTFFVADGYISAYTALTISLLTGLTLWFLLKRYLENNNLQIIIFSLWSLSPFIISLDRIPWNPNLSIIAASLVFFPFLKKSKLVILDVLLVSIGVFLGYQAHFSGLLLLPLAGISLLLRFRKERFPFYYLALPVVSFFISIVPTIIFDLKNNWLNLNGLTSLLGNKDSVSSYLIFERAYEKLYITFESVGKIVFYFNSTMLIVVAGLLIAGRFTYQLYKKRDTEHLLASIWFLSVPLIFALYRSSTPEYYFIILVPVLMYQVARFLHHLGINLYFFIFFFFIYSSWLINFNYGSNNDLTLGNQKKIVAAIEKTSRAQPIGELRYDLKDVDALGLKYLLKSQLQTNQENDAIIHIIYPLKGKTQLTTSISERVALWTEMPQFTQTKVVTEDHVITLPKDWKILKDISEFDPAVFVIKNEKNEDQAELRVFINKNGYSQLSTMETLDQPATNGWQPVLYNSKPAYHMTMAQTSVILLTNNQSLPGNVQVKEY